MKRRLMASVLLAGMVFSLPVYADDDRTPDEYDPNARYESPLTQQQPVIVNDRPARKPDDDDRFAEAAGRITQSAASGKNKDEKKATVKDEGVLQAEQPSVAVFAEFSCRLTLPQRAIPLHPAGLVEPVLTIRILSVDEGSRLKGQRIPRCHDVICSYLSPISF